MEPEKTLYRSLSDACSCLSEISQIKRHVCSNNEQKETKKKEKIKIKKLLSPAYYLCNEQSRVATAAKKSIKQRVKGHREFYMRCATIIYLSGRQHRADKQKNE